MTDADRMDIMSLVKSGTMSVDQAMTRVRMKEQRASELRLQVPCLCCACAVPVRYGVCAVPALCLCGACAVHGL